MKLKFVSAALVRLVEKVISNSISNSKTGPHSVIVAWLTFTFRTFNRHF